MADEKSAQEIWLPVIGNALAFFCLERLAQRDPTKTLTLDAKVKFLEGLGIPPTHSAGAAESTSESVRVMKAKKAAKEPAGKGAKRAKKK